VDCKVKLMKGITAILPHFRLSGDFGESMGLLDKPLQVKRKRRKRVEHQCAYGEQEKELVERWKICLEERIWPVPPKMRDKGQ